MPQHVVHVSTSHLASVVNNIICIKVLKGSFFTSSASYATCIYLRITIR